MKKILASIQQGQFDQSQLQRLEALLISSYQQHVSNDKTIVVWCEIPPGQAYTAYQPSQSSLITMECPTGFEQQRRVAFLQSLAEQWIAITKQHPDYVLLSLMEEDLFNQFVRSNQKRLSAVGKVRFVLHMLRSFIRSKQRNDLFRFNPNL